MKTIYPKRLIEVDLPIKKISEHARREKSIRHGHISTLHIWWARRPLAACRAVICAALWPDPGDPNCPERFKTEAARLMKIFRDKRGGKPYEWDDGIELRKALLDFIADFANWDNSSNKDYLDTSRALTQVAHEALGGEKGTRSLVVDPFAGGGSIPLEGLRVGTDAFATDLNPIAVLLNMVALEYVPKYGIKLADEVRRLGAWVKKEADKELAMFYPGDPNGAEPIAYIWARTVLSESPSEENIPVEIPLIRSFWLANKKGRRVALRWKRGDKGQVQTRIEKVDYSDGLSRLVKRPLLEIFEPSSSKEVENGTSSGGAATCPISGFTVEVEGVRRQLLARSGGARDARLVVVVTTSADGQGRSYRLPLESDMLTVKNAELHLHSILDNKIGGYSLIPDEPLNHLRGFFNIVLYGMTKWGDLFSNRQILTLVTFAKHIAALRELKDNQLSADFQNAVRLCLSLALDRQADRNSAVCRWISQNENIGYTFGRQALPMIWDFVESLPFRTGGAWERIINDIADTIEVQSNINNSGKVEWASATSNPLPDDTADFLFTDPPYYSAVPYADLSDFFYVWLKRTISDIYPYLFDSPLSPKEEECVALSHRAAMYRNKNAIWFEKMMGRACGEGRRITKPNGIGCFVFANKETSGWESMLSAIIDAGWIVVGSWPIDTERPGRLRAQNSAALASSIHIVCRPRENPDGSLKMDEIGDWRDVLAELPKRIHDWMPRLAEEGVVGADAIFACLGPALEIFSRYSRVEKASGEVVPLKEYLEHVWAAVAKEALTMIFEGAETTGFEEDARLTAMWLWTLSTGTTNGNGDSSEDESEGDEEEDEEKSSSKSKLSGYTLEYDAARKIAQGLGAHLEKLQSLVEVKGDKARLLPVAERTRALFGKDEATAPKAKKIKKEQLSMFAEIEEAEESGTWGAKNVPQLGNTTLDRLHQSMILFAAGRGEALKRFLVEEGVGRDERFWRLAQAFSALYPKNTDEKRWVDGVLARKKGLGL